MKNTIQFLGAAGTVTGSKALLRIDGVNVLVDCGLFQGIKAVRLRNWAPFPVDLGSIHTILLTHAHLDHCGYLPLLIRSGFKGPIYCTPPTRDLAEVILLDSAKIQEEDAERANRGKYSKHSPALPLYTMEDARQAVKQMAPRDLNTWHSVEQKVHFRLTPSGHILGSSLIEVRGSSLTVAFTGDLGRTQPLMLPAAEPIAHADYLVTESTYGDRLHPALAPDEELKLVLRETADRGGHVIIPSFAVGRAQDLLLLISRLKRDHEVPEVPVFLDSPMGANATEILLANPTWHTLSYSEIKMIQNSYTIIGSSAESEELRRRREPSIVIAGSGTLSGGRVLNHLEFRLPDPKNTILLTGYQPAGTRGSLLKNGIGELKIRGRYVPVRARTAEITTLSAHADQGELLNWYRGFSKPPRQTFIVHGEEQASDALRVKIKDTLNWPVIIPEHGQQFEL